MGRRRSSSYPVKLVLEQSYTIAEASKSLGVEFSAELAEAICTSGKLSMQAELRRLREENKRLLMEREILKKATAFFGTQSTLELLRPRETWEGVSRAAKPQPALG